MTERANALVSQIAGSSPAAQEQYQKTVRECEAEGLGENIPEFFLDEYARGLIGRFRDDPVAERAPLATLASTLEDAYGQDRQVDELIRGWFLVHIPDRTTDPDPAQVLGPRLATLLGAERRWRGEPEQMAFVERLVNVLPRARQWANESVYGDHQDVLVHPFLWDVARWTIEEFLTGRTDEIARLLTFLDSEFPGAAQEPIAASFVQHLPYPQEPAAALTQLLGPRLRAELNRQRGSSQPGRPAE